jgi:isopenicillin N synthase-like dioxygenase
VTITVSTPKVPIIDVGHLRSGRRSDLEDVGRQIGEAARSIGFFSIVNHGLERTVADALTESRRFFGQPLEAKETVRLETYFRGYTGIGRARRHHYEAFDVGTEIAADDPAVLAGISLVAMNRWPDLPGFRGRITECFDGAVEMFIDLHRAIALDLGADPEYFTPYFPRMVGLRLLHYPPHPESGDGPKYGNSPHTDFGNLTLLAQDTPGLELRMLDGTWIPVEVRTDALVCNIGDCLMRWSNDLYVSTPHRVINRSGRDRFAIAIFGDVNEETVVSCLPSCELPDKPAKHPAFLFADYARERFESAY